MLIEKGVPTLPNAARGVAKLTLELAGSKYSYSGWDYETGRRHFVLRR
jgi:hypothetical protein